MTDYSPDGIDERAEHDRATLRALAAADIANDADRIAADVIRERLELALEEHDAGERLRDLRVLGSPVQDVRMAFDLMPRDTEEQWQTIAERIALVPQGLSSIEAALTEGVQQGIVAARRQAVKCAKQADVWGGVDPSTPPFFRTLVDEYDACGFDRHRAFVTASRSSPTRATAAYAAIGRYLVEEYVPHATEHDPVGRERYSLYARDFNGIELDLDETYAWGWEELYRIEHAMRAGRRAHPPRRDGRRGDRAPRGRPQPRHRRGRRVPAVEPGAARHHRRRAQRHALRHPRARAAGGGDDRAARRRRRDVLHRARPKTSRRPGRTWYPTLGKTRFPLWGEVSICYHEGVPGHHLQIAQVRYLADSLSRYQRTLAGTSGHAEGWALYAERLMGELGYLDDPAYELGMLRAQAMRAVRVVVDIGMHLELPIPAAERYHPGETWTPDLALPFVIERSKFPPDFMASEVDRYLGLPGQAISYKIGERVWLGARDAARRRGGDAFDLKEFHRRALDLGPMGLDQLDAELARL